MSHTTITAKATVPGLHHWPTAHDSRAYLREPHRHLFVARATVYVGHDDRDVEFHDLGDDLQIALERAAHSTWESLHDFGAQSCEALARHCAAALASEGYSLAEVSVSEDDEFTATVYPDPISLTGGAQ